ncbi:hypothetical protein IWX83_003291 [Flavobacterium sp. CG_9.1]|uniref:hypothetical protein n=1 Tax=Flavobacterium sp. CG_9.1 TaxID=2787728 RepID=UPI0018CB6A43|nr:hypothetical protein [Flavobacterium sp. CG_9.1]MBG6063481.1 hypothetical protein [Flavobacterium sp. CG_9.1]
MRYYLALQIVLIFCRNTYLLIVVLEIKMNPILPIVTLAWLLVGEAMASKIAPLH